MTTWNDEKNGVRGYGKLPLIAAALLTANNGADPTIVHSAGIEAAARTGEGAYTCTLSNNVLDVLASGFPFAILYVHIDVIATDGATQHHKCQVISAVPSTGVITFAHLQAAFAGPAALVLDDGAAGTQFVVSVYAMEA